MTAVLTGLDRLNREYVKKLSGFRLGLLANQASVNGNLNSAKEVLSQLFPGQLKALFGPQHGHGGEDQDNMVETSHASDKSLKIPVFSLYAQSREPSREMLDRIDILMIDLQDVGTRVYTFTSTMLHCMKAAAKYGKKVIVLDRPNPLGGQIVEGNLLDPELFSFVGPSRIPMRHGLTMGEMALYFDHRFALKSDLEIITMEGWRREMFWKETGLRWIMPSPNMPLPETALVYPGQVLWEGTNISEGRGTCRPFEILGAPFLETNAIKHEMGKYATEGCYLQNYQFRPTFGKWAGELCHGFMIHVLDPAVYRPYFTSICLLHAILKIHKNDFNWKQPPYEYEYKKIPIDLILGNSDLRRDLESGKNPLTLKEKWSQDIESFLNERKGFLLYF